MTPGALDAIVAETAALSASFRELGYRLFLVGGAVRDLFLEHDPGTDIDLDLTTDADPDAIKRIVGPVADALWLQGERFGTIGALINGRPYEITTHRSEVYDDSSRKPTVAFSTAVEEDLSRRDFTVNAMAVELPFAELIDPFGGRDDMHDARLRTPLDPEVSFADDPLRMLRAARFTAGYGLVPVPDLIGAMRTLAERLDIVSAERVRDELDKLLEGEVPSVGLALLADTVLLCRFLPEVDVDTLARRSSTGDAMRNDPGARLDALLYGCDLAQVDRRLSALRYSTDRRHNTVGVLRAAQRLAEGAVHDAPSLRRWVADSGDRRLLARELVALLEPDGPAIVERSEALEAELGSELDDLGPALRGQEVMDILGVAEGPVIGEALGHLQQLRFERGIMTAAQERTALETWWLRRA